MNNVVAFCQKRMLYLPELNPICGGNILATILMGQLEYWFSKQEKGFYKFLSPCNHSRYVKGDSWTEEMGFSECQFRAAFDKIGVRYRSYNQMKEIMEQGKDPFDGALYLSYYDTQTKLTIYHRNGPVVDKLLKNIVDDYKPNPEANNNLLNPAVVISEEPPIPQLRNSDLRISQMRKSKLVTEKFLGTPSIRNTETSNTETTAAKEKFVDHSKISEEHNVNTKRRAAAAKDFKNNLQADAVIGESLTDRQKKRVEELASLALAGQYVSGQSKDLVYRAIEYEILNPQCFSQAGKNFEKKYNTLHKQIKKGKWTLPASLFEQAKKSSDKQMQALKCELLEVKGEYNHWQKRREIDKQRGEMENMGNYEKWMKDAKEKISHCQQQIMDILKKSEKQGVCDGGIK